MTKVKCKKYFWPLLKDWLREQGIEFELLETSEVYEILIDCPIQREQVANKIKRIEFLNENY